VRVWDLPTRIFHWALVACFIGSIVSVKIGGNALAWHLRFGYAVFALLAFRLIWGFIGGRWSRFAAFVYSPAALGRYLRGQSRSDEFHDVGHSPLGSGSVFAMLAFLTLQVGSGLFADDEIANAGPLVRFVSGATSSKLTAYHADIGRWVILALVVLHIGAIVYYRVHRKRDLVGPMIRGDKLLPAQVPAAADDWSMWLFAAVLFAACAASVGLLVWMGS
jgi:cytochrome b